MSGFLRRVAGAFVEFPDEPPRSKGKDSGGRGASALDALTDDAAELLAQLEHHPAPSALPAGGGLPGSMPAGHGFAAGAGGDPGAPPSEAMAMNADDVFRAAGIPDGPNSAERLLRIIAGLTMFPPEQQVVMVRAMDQADDTWSEPAVLEDARVRQAALQAHLQRLDHERAFRIQQLRERIAATQAEGKSLCDDIDARIADLMAKREEAVVQTTAAAGELEAHIQSVETGAQRARSGIAHVIEAFSGLLSFFSAASVGANPRPQ